MNVLDGVIPDKRIWRAMVLFGPEQEPGLSWTFALQLAKESSGEAVGIAILSSGSTENAIREARSALKMARECAAKENTVHTLLVEAENFREALLELIEAANIDLVLADGDSSQWRELDNIPCDVSIIRGGAYQAYNSRRDEREQEEADGGEAQGPAKIRRILVPTAGGPNTAEALSLLLPMTPNAEITALYVAPEYLGENEIAHGEARLRQLVRFADASDRVERSVIQAASVTEGIVEQAKSGYDLVLVGATRESTLDRALFGDVVGAVVRESKTPVAVFWEAASTFSDFWRNLAWNLQNVVPRLKLSQRTDVYVRIRRSARPSTDFFILIGLSTLIAALGLLLSSPAVVIGAMLVAPLMSPMIGAGLAIVLGNPRFLRLSLGAVLRGTFLSILLGVLTGFLQPDGTLTPELLARTQPTLLDLGVAVFAGFAGAYALSHSEAAAALPGVAISAALVPPLATVGIAFSTGNFRESAGALLLYSTNLVAIVAAAVFVFIVLGFRPSQSQKTERAIQRRTVRIALILLGFITFVLGTTTISLAREARLEARVHEVVERHTSAIEGVEFAGLSISNLSDSELPLALDLTVRSTRAIAHSTVEALRDQIGAELGPELENDRGIAMDVTVIRVTKLDPEVPPTATPTPEPTATPTPTATALSPAYP